VGRSLGADGSAVPNLSLPPVVRPKEFLDPGTRYHEWERWSRILR